MAAAGFLSCYLNGPLPHVPSSLLCARGWKGKEVFYLTMHATHFIYGYMVSDIWLRTILIVRKETCCRNIGYYFRLTARVLLYAPSHRQDSTYHGLCYTSRGALAGTRNSSMVQGDMLFDEKCNVQGDGLAMAGYITHTFNMGIHSCISNTCSALFSFKLSTPAVHTTFSG